MEVVTYSSPGSRPRFLKRAYAPLSGPLDSLIRRPQQMEVRYTAPQAADSEREIQRELERDREIATSREADGP